MNDLEALKLAWTPLTGNDTNGPLAKTANTIIGLVNEIEALRSKGASLGNDVQVAIKFAQDQTDKQADEIAALQKNVKDLEDSNERLIKTNDAFMDDAIARNTGKKPNHR